LFEERRKTFSKTFTVDDVSMFLPFLHVETRLLHCTLCKQTAQNGNENVNVFNYFKLKLDAIL
jgi:hypothetical protein